MPGLAARLAGPSSLVVWILLSLASYPFAYTFASLSSRRPEAGGVYTFARESFGFELATVSGWLFALLYITGGPAVSLIAASYLAYAFPLSRAETYFTAGAILFAAFAVNYRGIVLSNKVQLTIVTAIMALIVGSVIGSIRSVRLENFFPLFPNGFFPIGVAAALIFLPFIGYENVSNVAEEFQDPKRDFHRSILISVFVVGGLYVSVAFATVGTLAYAGAGSTAPFAAIASNILGRYGAAGTAVLAIFIDFGAVNAYTTGLSRVVYVVARDGGFPKFLDHLDNKTRVPNRSLLTLSGLSMLMLGAFYVLEVDLETALLVTSGAAIMIYAIGSGAGIRLLRGGNARRILPWMALLISLGVLPFVGIPLLLCVVAAVVGLIYRRIFRRTGVC